MQYKILLSGGRKEWIQEFAEPTTIVDIAPLDLRRSMLPDLDYQFYEHIHINGLIRTIVKAEKDGYDAFVIGCFYDPGLKEARELVDMPVVGVCEASLSVASMITSGKFSVIVGSRKNVPHMADNARNYGFESRIASWRMLNIPPRNMGDKEKLQNAILREAKAAVEGDLAECVVLGCTGMWGQAKKAQEELGIPILDPVIMGLKVAELRAMIWKKLHISQSKIGGYKAPPQEELEPIYSKIYGSYP
jgi:allantoin racemase